jgi:hypothetical protein
MKRPELLEVMLKALGCWSVISGLSGLPQAVSFLHVYPDEQESLLMMADTFVGPGILIVTGWFLVRSTHWFIGIADRGNNWLLSEESTERSRELFAVVLVALGYWEILNGVVRLPYEFARLYRASEISFAVIAYSGIAIVAGCFLVFATEWFVQFAYRERVEAADGEPDSGSD